jgi:hypothetical protein
MSHEEKLNDLRRARDLIYDAMEMIEKHSHGLEGEHVGDASYDCGWAVRRLAKAISQTIRQQRAEAEYIV